MNETRKTLGKLWKESKERQKAFPDEEKYYLEFKAEIDGIVPKAVKKTSREA